LYEPNVVDIEVLKSTNALGERCRKWLRFNCNVSNIASN